MADEKRLRGAKDIEAAYRQGFVDGSLAALEEHRLEREREAKRETAISAGLKTLREQLATAPKRKRRRKADGNGVAAVASDGV